MPDCSRYPDGVCPDDWGWVTTKPKGEVETGNFDSIYCPPSGCYQHQAEDIGIPTGNEVLSPVDGVVTFAGWSTAGYGNLVVVKYGVFDIFLGHMSEILVGLGRVVKGQVLGKSGSTGNSSGPHIHFEVRKNGTKIDPMQFYKDTQSGGTPVYNEYTRSSDLYTGDGNKVTDKMGDLPPQAVYDSEGKEVKTGCAEKYAGDAIGYWACVLGFKNYPKYGEKATPSVFEQNCKLGDIQCYISNLLLLPATPEERKYFYTRIVVGIAALFLVYMALRIILEASLLVNAPALFAIKHAPGIIKTAKRSGKTTVKVVKVAGRAGKTATKYAAKKAVLSMPAVGVPYYRHRIKEVAAEPFYKARLKQRPVHTVRVQVGKHSKEWKANHL